jgi:hypothetical protein
MTVPQYTETATARHHHAVEQLADQFKNVMYKAFRPLPTETGDGTENEKASEPSPFDALASLRPSDPETLFEMGLQKFTGADIDDKTYIMERVIEVGTDHINIA